MIYWLKREAVTGVSVDGADVWHERLGWAFGPIDATGCCPRR